MDEIDNYHPWHADYWMGLYCLLFSSIGGWWLVLTGHYVLAVWLTVWSLKQAWRFLASGFARENGVEVERRAVRSFLSAMSPEEFNFRYDVRMSRFGVCIGNVDMVVSSHDTQASFCVEIKAYSGILKYWYGWRRLGKWYRLWSPQKQVKNQCKFLGKAWHFPVLWLPESKLDNWFIADGILVVNGDANLLIDGLRRFNEIIYLPTSVAYPWAPGDAYTGYLKNKGYKYDGNRYRWYGRESCDSVGPVIATVSYVNGKVYWVQRE